MSAGPPTSRGPHLDDEQLSLVVDELADPEAVAHAERCPDCAARAARWSQVRDLVASPPAPPDDHREAAIRAALEVFDAEPDQPDQTSVIDLAGARRRRIRWSRSALAVPTVAAALLLVAGLGIGLSRGSHHHSSVATSGSSAASNAAPTGVGAATPSQPPSAAVPAPSAPAATLGSFPNMAALLAALRSHVGEAPSAASGSASASSSAPASQPRCQPAASAAIAAALATVPEFHAALTYAGTPAVVYVYQAPARRVAVVLSETSCRLLAKSSF